VSGDGYPFMSKTRQLRPLHVFGPTLSSMLGHLYPRATLENTLHQCGENAGCSEHLRAHSRRADLRRQAEIPTASCPKHHTFDRFGSSDLAHLSQSVVFTYVRLSKVYSGAVGGAPGAPSIPSHNLQGRLPRPSGDAHALLPATPHSTAMHSFKLDTAS
jgi:hypothetical protein